jgi:hypothetical protein
MKLEDIIPGSDEAYREAVRIVREQIDFELDTCAMLLGTDPKEVLRLIFELGKEDSHDLPTMQPDN